LPRKWSWVPLAIAVAVFVYLAMDRLSAGRPLISLPPKPFIPPPAVKPMAPPVPPEWAPVPPRPPVLEWEKQR
jgi:hypothetical protein